MGIKNKQLVIIGAGEFGEIAYEYFTEDSEYQVVAFSAEKRYRDIDELRGIPVVDFESVDAKYPPSEYEVFIAVTYVKMNRERRRLYQSCKERGYRCASYISSHSFVWKNAIIGENTFIFENNTIQYNVTIGNNVVLWSGNHIGHRTVIEDDVWLTSHDVIAGFCHIGKGCFIGVNAAFADGVTIAEDIIVGMGSVVNRDLNQARGIYIGVPARLMEEKTSLQYFGVDG